MVAKFVKHRRSPVEKSASISGWTPKSIDIQTAFLQGKPLEFIQPPIRNVKRKLWKLLKPVYGLQDAPKQWYLRVKIELIKAGLTVCPIEPALFMWSNDGNCAGLICLHVDDFLWVGTPDFQTLIINNILCQVFNVGKEDDCPKIFTGVNVYFHHGTLTMSQDHFIREIKSVTECSGANDPLSDEEITALRGALGKLQWVASQIRPDLAFGVNSLTGTGEKWLGSRVRDTKNDPTITFHFGCYD